MSCSFRLATIAVVLALALSVQTNAQPNGGPIIGLHIGGSMATLSSDDLEDLNSRFGLKAGGSATFPLSGNIGVQTGLDYAEKGTKLEDDEVEEGLSVDYIELPVMLRFDVPVAGSVAPHFAAGPAFAFQIGCEFTASFQGQSASSDCEDEGLEIASFDVGLMAGAGISYAVSGAMAVTLDVLYNLGFTNIDAGDDPVDATNRAWSFLLGIEFPILR